MNKQIATNDTVIDQRGRKSIVISVWDNVVVTTRGTYHITKLWAVK